MGTGKHLILKSRIWVIFVREIPAILKQVCNMSDTATPLVFLVEDVIEMNGLIAVLKGAWGHGFCCTNMRKQISLVRFSFSLPPFHWEEWRWGKSKRT